METNLLKTNKKVLPIGNEDFIELTGNNYYYVDKTLAIKDIIDNSDKVMLFTRPRRFGKTMFLSMVKTFFEDSRDSKLNKINTLKYFNNLEISKYREYLNYQGTCPVINLTFKDIKQITKDTMESTIQKLVVTEYLRHQNILKSDKLTNIDKELYNNYTMKNLSYGDLIYSLKILSELLYKVYNKKVIVLIDEYDTILEQSYFNNFYEEMNVLITGLLGAVLKTNEYLEFGILTGCLRISKESIFSGLNNLMVNTVNSKTYAEYFGFTEDEVSKLLNDYGVQDNSEEIKRWYNGYLFGDANVYNPWSILNCIKDKTDKLNFKQYWVNTSSNKIIENLPLSISRVVADDLRALMDSKTIQTTLLENVTFNDVYDNSDYFWNVLYNTGYLTQSEKGINNTTEDFNQITLKVPNIEILILFKEMVKNWCKTTMAAKDILDFIPAMEKGDCETMQSILQTRIRRTLSYYDTTEAFYHGFCTGLLQAQEEYYIESNRESGNGRFDLALQNDNTGKVYIFEMKLLKDFKSLDELENAAIIALKQIDNKEYNMNFELRGYKVARKYAIVFAKKICIVRTA